MTTALIAAAALVVLASVLGLVWRGLDGRRRSGSGERVRPADVGLGAAAFGERATLLQFSTAWCTRCPSTRRLLGATAERTAGVRHAEVDLTERADLASRYGVLQTPTVLVLDRGGAVRVRIAGAPRSAAVETALTEVLGPPDPQGAPA